MKKANFFELSLVLGLVITMCISGYASNIQHQLAQKLMRVHIIANSDTPADQALKLKVRDKVITLADSYTASAKNAQQARDIISAKAGELTRAAREEIYSNGYTYPVRTEIVNMYFPTREYETFSLPAGYYDAFRVIIGEGKGKNWWCVMFPPLCISPAEDCTNSVAESAGLSEEELKLIASGKTVYRCKFKAVELVSQFKEFLQKNIEI